VRKSITRCAIQYTSQLVPTPSVTVSIPADKISKAYKLCCDALRHKVISLKAMRSGTGKCQNIANVVTTIKPFCSYLWAALATSQDSPAKRGKHQKLAWVKVRRAQHGIKWLKQYFSGKRGPLERTFRLKMPEPSWLVISVDASPWGIGGIMHTNGIVTNWFTDVIQDSDLRVLNAVRADPAFQTTWEALAILVAVRLWLQSTHDGIRIEIRSDSLRLCPLLGWRPPGPKPYASYYASLP
jgi:hypothetical protein